MGIKAKWSKVVPLRARLRTHKVCSCTHKVCSCVFYLKYHQFSLKSYVVDVY